MYCGRPMLYCCTVVCVYCVLWGWWGGGGEHQDGSGHVSPLVLMFHPLVPTSYHPLVLIHVHPGVDMHEHGPGQLRAAQVVSQGTLPPTRLSFGPGQPGTPPPLPLTRLSALDSLGLVRTMDPLGLIYAPPSP